MTLYRVRQYGLEQGALEITGKPSRSFAEAGDRAGVAAALNNMAVSLGNENDISGARKLYEEALAIRREIGDKKGMSGSLNNIAILLKEKGDLSGAQKMHEEALAIRREVGNKSEVALSLNNIGVVLFEQDRLTEATRRYEESLAISREVGEKRGMVRALHNLAIVLKDQGKLADANKLHEQSLSIRREIGDKRGVPLVLHHMGIVLFEQGSLAAAKKNCEEALELERGFNQKRGIAFDLLLLGELLLAEGNLAGARKNHEEALAIRRELGEKRSVAESQLDLGVLALEEGQPTEAEGLIRKALDEFQRERGAAEARGHVVLAQALLAQNRTQDAEKAIERATELAGKSETLRARLSVAITGARVLAASGQSGEALGRLEAVLAETKKTGLVPLQFEARLALGEVEVKSFGTAGRDRLRALEKDARVKGFGLIARKAAAHVRSESTKSNHHGDTGREKKLADHSQCVTTQTTEAPSFFIFCSAEKQAARNRNRITISPLLPAATLLSF
jgi:tetratricopeptide (TPR) repeat protein